MVDFPSTGTKDCPVAAALDVISGKWKALIILRLLLQPKLRFGELVVAIPRVSRRMLSTQLRELEADGIIVRKVYAEVPPRVEYSLTTLGYSLEPVLREMAAFGATYLAWLARS